MDEEIVQIFEFLSDGKEHFDYPDIEDYDDICNRLEAAGFVDLGMTKDDGVKLTRKGKRVWEAYKQQLEENLDELEFIILKILFTHNKQIVPTKEPRMQICDYPELMLYTKGEITECCSSMQNKGWITCFIEGDHVSWCKLLDPGLIILRNYLNRHPERLKCLQANESQQTDNNIEHNTQAIESTDDQELIDALLPIFYGEEFLPKVKAYIAKMRSITDNGEKASYTASLVNKRTISPKLCHRHLYKVLFQYGLYTCKEGTWNKSISQHIDAKSYD